MGTLDMSWLRLTLIPNMAEMEFKSAELLFNKSINRFEFHTLFIKMNIDAKNTSVCQSICFTTCNRFGFNANIGMTDNKAI